MKTLYFLLIILVYSSSCGNTNTRNSSTKESSGLSSDTCDGPDAHIGCCFINTPQNMSSIMNIADNSEPGQRIIIKGQILKEDGKTPYPGILMYAYHTDDTGIYSKKGNETGFQKWHGHLHGWCVTDAEGKYEIHTTKPGRYPTNNAPAHIHCAIKEPSGNMTYINDFVFSGDSFVDKEYLSYLRLPGDNGVITLYDKGNGVQEGNRITVLKF